MATAPKTYPFQNNKIAIYLTKQIDALSSTKTQREIAQEAGYDNVNILSMFKRGQNRVPMPAVPALAKALNVDPAFLLRLALEQYYADTPEIMNNLLKTAVSANEEAILKFIREESGESDPPLSTVLKEKIREGLTEYAKV